MGSAATSLSSPSTIDRDQWNRYFDEMCKADGDDSEVVTYQTLVDWATKCVKKRNHQADAWLKEWGATQELPKAFRTVELDALQSAVATGSQNHQMLSAQLLPLETLAKTIPSRLVGEIFLTNKSALEAAVHDADKLRVYSHRAFKEMIPTVISEITPSLISTRSRYDVVYDQVLKNDAEALSQLGKQLALMNTSAGPDSTKPVQHLSSSSLNEFFGCDNEDDLPDSARSNPKFMLGLLRDAVETKSIFDAEMNRIGQELDGTVACKLAPLKGMERALVKVHEKYSGVYAELTDMVRATFLCDSVSDMVRVAQALQASDAFECKRSKHRCLEKKSGLQRKGRHPASICWKTRYHVWPRISSRNAASSSNSALLISTGSGRSQPSSATMPVRSWRLRYENLGSLAAKECFRVFRWDCAA